MSMPAEAERGDRCEQDHAASCARSTSRRSADAADVAVLYPQPRVHFALLNLQACTDWWGYSGADYHSRQGAQLRWRLSAVRALGWPLGH